MGYIPTLKKIPNHKYIFIQSFSFLKNLISLKNHDISVYFNTYFIFKYQQSLQGHISEHQQYMVLFESYHKKQKIRKRDKKQKWECSVVSQDHSPCEGLSQFTLCDQMHATAKLKMTLFGYVQNGHNYLNREDSTLYLSTLDNRSNILASLHACLRSV